MGKSHKHKTQNIHHFIPFSERISNVNVDVIHLIRKVHDEGNEESTNFGDSLARWTDLDLTEHFNAFRREISGQVQTFEQLVHHKESIISALKIHLAIKDSMALSALLDLLVSLSRDLQQDFLPHFSDFFHLLLAVLSSRSGDIEAVEAVFQSLALLYRALWRFLIRDFEQVFGYFTLLLRSPKEHIRIFAAESSAYLLRKVKKRDRLLNYLFKILKKNPELSEGVGLLLFEMVKGVRFHFHTVFDEIFPLILSKLGGVASSGKKLGLPLSLMEDAVSVFFEKCAEHSTKEHNKGVWEMLLNSLTAVHASCAAVETGEKKEMTEESQACEEKTGGTGVKITEEDVPASVHHLRRLLKLTSIWLDYDSGSIVSQPEQVAKVLLAVVKSPPRPDCVGEDVLGTVVKLLASCQDQLPPNIVVKLTSAVFTGAFKFSDLKVFVKTTMDMPFFEKDIMPGCMNRIEFELPLRNPVQQQDVMAFIAELLLIKCGSPITGEDLHLLTPYSLDKINLNRSSKDNKLSQYVDLTLMSLTESSSLDTVTDISTLWATVVCCPHLNILNSVQKMVAVWSKIVEKLKCCENPEERNDLAIVANQLIRGILISFDEDDANFPVMQEDVMDILRCDPSNPSLLQTADFFFSHPKCAVHLTPELLADVYRCLELNLVSPSHTVRLLTSHLLSLFPVELPDYGDEIKREDIFTTILKAEKMIPTVHNYREKLVYLRKLEHDMAAKCLPSALFAKAPLLFLLGNEHWNFKLLWEPLVDIIATHAHGMGVEEFWAVWLAQLQKAALESEKELQFTASPTVSPVSKSEENLLYRQFSQYRSELLLDTRRQDFTNYRLQLWRAMRKFSEKCSAKCDDLCTLYLNFLRNEFEHIDGDCQRYQDIKSQEVANTSDSFVDMDEGIPLDEEDEDEEEKEEEQEAMDVSLGGVTPSVKVRRKKPTTLSLLVHLDLFALFKKQKFMFKKPEVQDTFHELLKSRNSTIQKAAFEVIISYKSQHLLPYRENFNRLLDDKTFKSEIVLFQVSEENTQVKESDREGLLPVLMSILLGKMHGKAGKDTAGASKSRVRKSIVFGFLTGCKHHELTYFLKLLYEPCMHFVTDNPVGMVKGELESIDFKKMIPLKKIKGVLNTTHTVLQKLGHHLADFTHPMLHVLLGLSALLSSALDRREMVIKGAVNLLKSLRHTVVIRVTEFLEYYEDLDFTASELDALFQAVVWPSAEKLVLEGVHHPTPLLKLFVLWSKSHRLIPLLGHYKDQSFQSEAVDLSEFNLEAVSPLSCMFSLLNAPTTSPNITSVILEIVQNVLNLDNEETKGEPGVPTLPGVHTPSGEGKQLGELFISPHVPSLLSYLQKALAKLVSGSTGKKHTQNFILELKILACVSRFVKSAEESQGLCELLIPYLASGTNLPENIEENTLASITNLMSQVKDPQVFYRQVCQLFGSIERRASRALLCSLFKVINNGDSEKSKFAGIVEKLNKWDRRKAEEPDFNARLEAFHEVNSLLSCKSEPDINFLLPVVYNCCYFINAVDDLSIRDNSTHCLATVINQIASCHGNKAFNVVVEKCLVAQVKHGVRSKSEAVRHEFLAVLQAMVNKFPTHPMFSGLTDLCDKDPEADFFENIRHIQMHKRSRALRRVYKHLKDHHMTADLHLTYFLPLIYAFITDPSYAKHTSLQDAAVDLLAAVCKQLPWQHYLRLLQFYLKLLPKKQDMQRQIVRIIVALLDGFHFDLSNTTFKIHIRSGVKKTASEGSDKFVKDVKEVDTSSPSQEDTLIEESTEAIPEFPEVDMDVDVEGQEEEMDDSISKTDGKLVCSVAAATRIHKTIVLSLLPQLHRVITQKTKGDEVHKLAGKVRYPEDEEILRVPIALAMIKLLQNLPKGTLENRLPGILLKICNFLKSRSRDIRTSARETLQKAALSLGAKFFPFIIKELQSALTRGYQLHVLGFTTYFLLHGVQPMLKPGDLDPAVRYVQAVFHTELFGQVAEEKEVAAIRAKYFEAKTVKAFDAYEILAKFVSPACLSQLIKPVREILETTSSQRIANRSENLLRKIGNGLMSNPAIPLQTMMVFVHSLTTKLMDQITTAKPKEDKSSKAGAEARMPESCLLLQKAIPRTGLKPHTSKRTNAHILVEFGMQLLNSCLKSSALLPSEVSHLQMLDPFVPTLRDCLATSHVKTSAMALRCLMWMLKFPLPSLKENVIKIAECLFVVLQNYVGSASSKGGNQELITVCFKTVTVLVREVTYHQITKEQLQVLLTYCEEDLYNYSRQSTAFNLVRAILSRKLDIPQLHQVMEKLFEMSIVSQVSNLRLQSRQVLLHYLMNYPLGKELKRHLIFYIDHLQYELEDGRASALEMMISMFDNFPKKILNNHCPKFFSPLAMASYNDDSIRCRRLVCVALKSLIGKIDVKCRRTLFQEVLKWLKSDDINVRTMGCQACGLFVEVEGAEFEQRLKEIVPLVQQQMDPGRFAKADEEEDSTLTEQRDMNLLSLLSLVTKMTRELSLAQSTLLVEDVDAMWGHLLSHQLYPHAQVRVAACQLAGLFFSAWDPSDLPGLTQKADNNMQEENPLKNSYYLKNCTSLTRTFGKAFCVQMQAPNYDNVLATQIVKNLVYLSRLSEALDRTDDLVWLAKKFVREANHEVIHNVKVTVKRSYVFKWVAAVGVTLKPESVGSVMPVALPALQRELADINQDEELKNLVQEVLELLKKQVGVETFTSAFAKCHQWRAEKKDVRKRKTAAEAVTDPDIAARKKIRHHEKKKEAKKRSHENKRHVTMKRIKKNKLSILNVKVDED